MAPQPIKPSSSGPKGATDLTRWHLDSSDEGRAIWTYDSTPDRSLGQQSFESKYWLSIHPKSPALPDPAGHPYKAARNGFEFYKQLQSPDGHWSGEYGGPLFLIPGLIICCFVTATPLPYAVKTELLRYVANEQRQGPTVDDCGWGLHVAGKSSVFGTALNYVACRLLGLEPDHPMLLKARATLHALGGATGLPTWGKVWLSILNVYDWEGVIPIPPELWLFPELLPFHPWRWWIHSRQIYIPMSYLSGKRFKIDLNPLLRSLRDELYTQPYESIDWLKCRDCIAKTDLKSPRHPVGGTVFWFLGQWEKVCPRVIRDFGLERVSDLCHMEDENTSYQDLAPVNKMLNMVVCWVRDGPDSSSLKQHRIRLADFLWMTNKGMLVNAANGSQLWDLAFITQALVDSGIAHTEDQSIQRSVVKALGWLDRCQITQNPKHYLSAYRHASKGAWPFSTREQSYTVSDCTAEALKSVIHLQHDLSYTPKLVSKERMCSAVDVLLGLQNSDGGFASYELIRGPSWLEWLNPAEVFNNTMVELSYPECTTACLAALSLFGRHYPDYRLEEISRARLRAIDFVHASQRPDGSWYGSWGVCFTYATMFALESLSLNDENYNNSPRVKKSCKFLLDRQMEDGGWGESFKSCEQRVYIHHQRAQVVQTAWAILGLLFAKYPDPEPIKKACQLIMNRQKPNGEWEQEAIEGVFNETTAVAYPNYKFSWTIWALGKAYKLLPDINWTEGQTLAEAPTPKMMTT